MVFLSMTLQSCGVIEVVVRAVGRICEQPEFVVTKTADTNDGLCSADDCSLREAVITANACPGPQTIRLPAGHYPLTRTGADEDQA
ncbi:MAG: CSLREA domain-containing protein, partial [Anaerolineales bacterium]